MPQKHHVIKYEGVITPETEGVVHHMEVFHCDLPPGRAVPDYNGPCKVFGAERPPGLESCRQVIGAWAMGAVVCSHLNHVCQLYPFVQLPAF